MRFGVRDRRRPRGRERTRISYLLSNREEGVGLKLVEGSEMMSSTHQTSTDTDVFVYTGDGGAEVPDDVVRVLVDPSVTSIPDEAFCGRKKLTEVEL